MTMRSTQDQPILEEAEEQEEIVAVRGEEDTTPILETTITRGRHHSVIMVTDTIEETMILRDINVPEVLIDTKQETEEVVAEESPQNSNIQGDRHITCQWEEDPHLKVDTTNNVDITKTTTMSMITVTPTITAALQWIDQGVVLDHHLMEDTKIIHSMQCNTENQGRDLQEEAVPQEVGIQETSEDPLKILKEAHHWEGLGEAQLGVDLQEEEAP